MEESKKMQKTLLLRKRFNKKNHSIPQAVSIWLYFKHHILEKENVLKLLNNKEMDKKEFKILIVKAANPVVFGPSFCRSRLDCQQTSQRKINQVIDDCWKYYLALLHPSSPIFVKISQYGGLGLFAKKTTVIKPKEKLFPDILKGNLYEITTNDFNHLNESHYPSLFGSKYVMCGPLSLINHNCSSPINFSHSTTNKLAYAKSKKEIIIEEGEEIFVRYFPGQTHTQISSFFQCKCKGDFVTTDSDTE